MHFLFQAIYLKDGKDTLKRKSSGFLSIAKGSAGELKTQLMIAVDIGYIAEDIGALKIKEIEEIALMLGGLMKSFTYTEVAIIAHTFSARSS